MVTTVAGVLVRETQEGVGERPANDESGDSKTGGSEVQKKKLTWAQVVSRSVPVLPAKKGVGESNAMTGLS